VESVTISISGMVCGGCSGTVRQALLALDGVVEAEVSHIEANAVVSYEPSKVTFAQIKSAIEAAGYQVPA